MVFLRSAGFLGTHLADGAPVTLYAPHRYSLCTAVINGRPIR